MRVFGKESREQKADSTGQGEVPAGGGGLCLHKVECTECAEHKN